MLRRRKTDLVDHEEFNRAVSLIMDRVSSASEEDLQIMLGIQNDLLRLTLECMQEKRLAHD